MEDRPVYVGKHRIGRFDIGGDVDSPVTYQLSQGWLNECLSTHPECCLHELPRLPTRVLDLQAEGASEGCRIVQSGGRTGKYAALSHCWGGVITPVLSDGTIRGFLEDLPISQLAANFQDTVKIVRQLGIRYLWIDSLCILQDSELDWQVESANMAAVYQNAAVTIYASTSPGSKHGIFPHKESSPSAGGSPKPKKVRIPVSPRGDDEQFVDVQMLEEAEDEDLWKLDVMSPLAIRGWCLQELILSPRRLFCGKKQFYWQCLHGYHAADGLPRSPGVRTTTTEYRETMRQIHSTGTKPSREELLSEYYTLVSKYSQRRFSFGSDKLLALTGLTSQLHPAVGGEYIAGLWSCDITSGLIWRSLGHCATHSEEYRAPSWSWAVTDENIGFGFVGFRAPGKRAAELVGHKVELVDPFNPYGRVRSAQLTIRAMTKRFVRSTQRVAATHNIPHHEVGTVRFDDNVREDSRQTGTCPVLIITSANDDFLVSTVRSSEAAGGLVNGLDESHFIAKEHLAVFIDSIQGVVSCLVLRRAGESNAGLWERVGYLELRDLKIEDWIDSWKQQTITMI